MRTYPIKGLVIFLIVVLLTCPAFAIATVFLFAGDLALQIIFWLMCGVFFIIAAILFIYQFFFYTEVKENCIIYKMLFGKKVLPFEKIRIIRIEDGFYVVYKGDEKFCQFGTEQKNAANMVTYMEKHGVHVKR